MDLNSGRLVSRRYVTGDDQSGIPLPPSHQGSLSDLLGTGNIDIGGGLVQQQDFRF